MSATDRGNEGRGTGPRPLALAFGVAAGMLLVACAMLWTRFGSQVFLDAATNLWKTCF